MRGIAYRIPVPCARAQGTSNADRPACAMVAAYASVLRGDPPLGILRGMHQGVALAGIGDAMLADYDVPRDRLQGWAESINGLTIDPSTIPAQIQGLTLETFQRDAVARMTPSGGGLALGCGLGKTLAACAFAHAIQAKSVVILCPLNAMPTWKRYASFLPVVPVIHSMDSAHHLLAMQPVDLIIYDEAHLQGHFTAARTKNAHTLRLRSKAGLCLTGTLLHAGIIKSLSVQDLAIPGAAGFGNRWAAGEHFHCLVRKQIGGRTVTEVGHPPLALRAKYHEYLAKYTVALTPNSEAVRAVLQLPGQDVVDVPVGEPWVPIEQAAADLVHAAIARGEPIPSASSTAHALCQEGVDTKTDWVMQNLGDDPAVIFAAYTETLDLMSKKLTDAAISFVRVDGSVTGQERIDAQEQFQTGKVQVFLGQIIAAGISMDLFRTPYSICIDHPWRSEAYAQALARTHRRGQAERCTHWDLFANKLQKRIIERLRAGEAFNAETADWQQIKLATDAAAVS